MKKNTIRNRLTRLVWSPDKDSYKVLVVDRLAPGGVKAIEMRCVQRVDSTYIHVKCWEGGEETLIPLHRVVAILKEGEEVWSRFQRQ